LPVHELEKTEALNDESNRAGADALVVLGALVGEAWTQASSGVEVCEQGRDLAILCANCRIIAPELSKSSNLRPPAPSFESIAQRSMTNIEGMPHPELLDHQIRQLTADSLSAELA
jgi:hypothetical protein